MSTTKKLNYKQLRKMSHNFSTTEILSVLCNFQVNSKHFPSSMMKSVTTRFHQVFLNRFSPKTSFNDNYCFSQFMIGIGNQVISSAIWDKSARVNFSKTNQIARARRASANLLSLKNLLVLIYPKLHEKNHVITC